MLKQFAAHTEWGAIAVACRDYSGGVGELFVCSIGGDRQHKVPLSDGEAAKHAAVRKSPAFA